MAVRVRQPHDHERQRSEERPMLLRHVVPNNRAPFQFDPITYASKTLDLLLAGVKRRHGRCHDRAAIMDARFAKTWLIPVDDGCLYILLGTKYSHVVLIHSEDVMKAKGELVKAAKKLMWERGYEAVSPRDLLEESGAGQGSLYHHFKGKMDLASVALDEVSDEMCELARRTVGTDGSALDRVFRYLDVSRDGLKGCRMGRFAAESSIAEASLRKPVERYFRELQEILAGALRQAQADGELSKRLDASELALMLITVVQGGFVVSRVYRDRNAINRATETAKSLLKSLPHR
jgi:TetR/AcrR family transcriptional repressor of nem operon